MKTKSINNNLKWASIALFFSFLLLGINLKSDFGIIDDHEIVSYLGSSQNLEINEIIPTLLKTEVGKIPRSGRFRPIYYSFRIIETYLWGSNVFIWYLARILFFSIFLFYLIKLLECVDTNRSIKVCFFLLVYSSKFWSDIFSRLGPAETYAVPALMAYVYYFWSVLKKNKMTTHYLYLLVSLIICIGSKENFVFLIFPSLYLIYLNINKNVTRAVLSVLASVLCFAMIGIITFIAINKGSDVYGTPVSLLTRILSLFTIFKFKTSILFVLATVLYVLKITKSQLLGISKINIKDVRDLLFFQSLGIILFLIQVLFYGESIGSNRYSFPAIFFSYLMSLNWILFLAKNINIKHRAQLVLKIIFAIFLISSFSKNIRKSYANWKKTKIFQNTLTQIINKTENQSMLPIVFNVSGPIDYEPVFSTARYLKFLDIQNPYMINVSFDIDKFKDPFLLDLLNRLKKIEENGDIEEGISKFSFPENCISLVNDKSNYICHNGERIEFKW